MTNQQVIEIWQAPEINIKEWEVKHNNFLKTTFTDIIREYSLKQDCNVCGSITIQAIFHFNEEGNIVNIKILNESLDCEKLTIKDKESIKKQFLAHFQNIQFTPYFANKTIEFQIGIPTKC